VLPVQQRNRSVSAAASNRACPELHGDMCNHHKKSSHGTDEAVQKAIAKAATPI
jgi:hypothetical protein